MISLNWVKDYIDLEGEDLKELATKVTKAGINVEAVITNHIDHLVIGEVVECTDHPDSDHLHVCKVNVGTETIQIVCGAHNVRKGIKVPKDLEIIGYGFVSFSFKESKLLIRKGARDIKDGTSAA